MSEADHFDDEPVELAPWLDWPTCPHCGRRRQARCPTCGYATDAFPLADYQELGAEPRRAGAASASQSADVASSHRLLLMCPVCEEAFRPQFYDRCAACGYDFRVGVRIDTSDYERLSTRAVWATVALIATIVGVLIYFWAILRL